MIRLRLSRRFLRIVAWTATVWAALALCYLLGARLTPRDGAGRPLLLSPSVYAAERYRQMVLRWMREMERVDRDLTTLLSIDGGSDPVRLYGLIQEVEGLIDQAIAIYREAVFATSPPALTGLAEQVRAAAAAHHQAVLATAQWVGAPEPENRRAALEVLRRARGLRVTVGRSVWLNGP